MVTYRHFECRSHQQCLRFFDKKAVEDLCGRLGPTSKLESLVLPTPTHLLRHRSVTIEKWNQSTLLMVKDAIECLKQPTAAPSIKRNPKRKEQREARRAVRQLHKERRRAEQMRRMKESGPEGVATQKRRKEGRKTAKKNKDKGKEKEKVSDEDHEMETVENNIMSVTIS
jgi:hypothetical protein